MRSNFIKQTLAVLLAVIAVTASADVLKPKAGTGLDIYTNSGSGYTLKYSLGVDGSQAWGVAQSNNRQGPINILNGSLFAGGTKSTAVNGAFLIGTNVRTGSNPFEMGRTDATTSGAGLWLANRTNATDNVFVVYANQPTDSTATNATSIATATGAGAWGFLTSVTSPTFLTANTGNYLAGTGSYGGSVGGITGYSSTYIGGNLYQADNTGAGFRARTVGTYVGNSGIWLGADSRTPTTSDHPAFDFRVNVAASATPGTFATNLPTSLAFATWAGGWTLGTSGASNVTHNFLGNGAPTVNISGVSTSAQLKLERTGTGVGSVYLGTGSAYALQIGTTAGGAELSYVTPTGAWVWGSAAADQPQVVRGRSLALQTTTNNVGMVGDNGIVTTSSAAGTSVILGIGRSNTYGLLIVGNDSTGATALFYIHGINGSITKVAGDATWVTGTTPGASETAISYSPGGATILVKRGSGLSNQNIRMTYVSPY